MVIVEGLESRIRNGMLNTPRAAVNEMREFYDGARSLNADQFAGYSDDVASAISRFYTANGAIEFRSCIDELRGAITRTGREDLRPRLEAVERQYDGYDASMMHARYACEELDRAAMLDELGGAYGYLQTVAPATEALLQAFDEQRFYELAERKAA